MKTFNGKNITKKEIHSILRRQNTTEIFRLYHIIYGGKVEKSKVYDFIREFAPSTYVFDKAYIIVYTSDMKSSKEQVAEARAAIAFKNANQKHIAIQCLRENIARGIDNYSKRPIMGREHLWFASPVYRLNDYNKWRSVEIKGNERFCELICKVADKYFK